MTVKTARDSRPTGPASKKAKQGNDAAKDISIGQIKDSCPLTWGEDIENSGIGGCMNEEARLCLSVGWKNDPGEEEMVKQCLRFIDPNGRSHLAYCDELDQKAAEKALREKGSLEDIYEFTPAKEGEEDWTTSYQYKKTLTKQSASESLKSLFEGHDCVYPFCYCMTISGRALSRKQTIKPHSHA